MSGQVEIANTGPSTTISLNGDIAQITAGGGGQDGELVLLDAANKERIRIGRVKELMDGPGASQIFVTDYWGLLVRTPQGQKLIQIGTLPAPSQQPAQIGKPPELGVVIGDDNQAGSLVVKGQGGVNALSLDQDGARIQGDLEISGQMTIPKATMGGSGQDGYLEIRDKNNKLGGYFVASTAGGALMVSLYDGKQTAYLSEGEFILGGNGKSGQIRFMPAGAIPGGWGPAEPTVLIDASTARMQIGGNGANGGLSIYPATVSGQSATDSAKASIQLNSDRTIVIKNSTGFEIIRIEPSSAQPSQSP